jgi:hypothetical protein
MAGAGRRLRVVDAAPSGVIVNQETPAVVQAREAGGYRVAIHCASLGPRKVPRVGLRVTPDAVCLPHAGDEVASTSSSASPSNRSTPLSDHCGRPGRGNVAAGLLLEAIGVRLARLGAQPESTYHFAACVHCRRLGILMAIENTRWRFHLGLPWMLLGLSGVLVYVLALASMSKENVEIVFGFGGLAGARDHAASSLLLTSGLLVVFGPPLLAWSTCIAPLSSPTAPAATKGARTSPTRPVCLSEKCRQGIRPQAIPHNGHQQSPMARGGKLRSAPLSKSG